MSPPPLTEWCLSEDCTGRCTLRDFYCADCREARGLSTQTKETAGLTNAQPLPRQRYQQTSSRAAARGHSDSALSL